MPIISVKPLEGRSVEQKREFAGAVTKDAVRILNVKPEWATVLFDEFLRNNRETGGKLRAEKEWPI